MRTQYLHLRLAAAALLIAGLAACSGGENEITPDAGIDPTADAGPDLTEEMYDPSHVIDVQVDMATADWDELRLQGRSIFDVLGASCLVEPPPRPFTYFPAVVRIDGEEITNVAVRKKGFFGSLSETKPSLKIKFSEYDETQTFSGLKRLTLNNNKSDASHVKQCIGYGLFSEAGVPAPRCSFAKVTVNGEYLGVFTNVEGIKKPFVARHFPDDEGNLYEGALSDFRDGWVNTFQRKTNKADLLLGEVDDRSDIEELVPALQVSDSALLSTIEPLIDVDAFIDFWVMETIMMHADGYGRNTNNYYLYDDPTTGKFHFLPWGIDSILFNNVKLPWEIEQTPESVFAEGVLARRLYQLPETQSQYFAKMEEHLSGAWNESAILAEVSRMEDLLTPHLVEGEQDAFLDALTQVRNFVGARRQQLRDELDAVTTVEWTSELRDPWCLVELGDLDATFSGQWSDDFAATNPFADGSASLSSAVPAIASDNLAGATTFGVDPDSGKNTLRLVAWLSQAADPDTQESVALVVIISLADEDIVPQSLVLGGPDAEVSVLRLVIPPAGAPLEIALVGIAGDGVLQLDAAGASEGDAVSGNLSVFLYDPPF
jgi:hypothetical protein